jgi:hypothetical protein
MVKFTLPAQFEGVSFCQELANAGITINKDTSPLIDGNGDLWLDIDASKKSEAQTILDAHTGLGL